MSEFWILPEELDDYSTSEYAYDACRSASYILWVLSGRKFKGYTEMTEKYIDATEKFIWLQPSVDLYASDRNFRNDMFGRLSQTQFRLRNYPVKSITSIMNGSGQTLDPDSYELLNSSILSFASPVSDALFVKYVYGKNPPWAGRMAAKKLALEFTKGWEGDPDCALPERITSINREGVSYTILDNQMYLDDLKTGIYDIDLFLKTTNPDKARRPSKVFIPEGRKGYQGSRLPSQNIGNNNGWNILPNQGG